MVKWRVNLGQWAHIDEDLRTIRGKVSIDNGLPDDTEYDAYLLRVVSNPKTSMMRYRDSNYRHLSGD